MGARPHGSASMAASDEVGNEAGRGQMRSRVHPQWHGVYLTQGRTLYYRRGWLGWLGRHCALTGIGILCVHLILVSI